MPELKHFDDLGTVRFVTFSCYRRLPEFNRKGTKELFIEHLDLARNKHKFKIYGYVIMRGCPTACCGIVRKRRTVCIIVHYSI